MCARKFWMQPFHTVFELQFCIYICWIYIFNNAAMKKKEWRVCVRIPKLCPTTIVQFTRPLLQHCSLLENLLLSHRFCSTFGRFYLCREQPSFWFRSCCSRRRYFKLVYVFYRYFSHYESKGKNRCISDSFSFIWPMKFFLTFVGNLSPFAFRLYKIAIYEEKWQQKYVTFVVNPAFLVYAEVMVTESEQNRFSYSEQIMFSFLIRTLIFVLSLFSNYKSTLHNCRRKIKRPSRDDWIYPKIRNCQKTYININWFVTHRNFHF